MSKIRILLVDDHALFREGMRSLLEDQDDIEIVGEAEDGLEAVRLVSELKPTVVLMDINMPGVDGFRMIRTLKSDPACKAMELIVVSALGKGEIADRGGLPAGVPVLPKPVPFEQLEARVRRAVAEHDEGRGQTKR